MEFWFDRKVGAGERWKEEIFARMAWADGALLLLSENFFASEFIMREEIPVLQGRYEKEGFALLPVLLDLCFYDSLEFIAGLQLLNEEKIPLSEGEKPTRTMPDFARRLSKRSGSV